MTGLPSPLNRWLILGVVFPLAFLNGWLALRFVQYFQPLVTIFVLATLLAFILNYPVQFLQKRQVKRSNAVFLVFLLAAIVLIVLGVTLVPVLVEQLGEATQQLPRWIDSISQKLDWVEQWAVQHHLPVDLSRVTAQLDDRLPDEVQTLTDELITLTVDAIDSVSEALLTAVLTFYLLLDGDRIWQGLFKHLPGGLADDIRRSLQQNFQNYFIGQFVVAALLSVCLTLAFFVLGVPFALVWGLAIGTLALIPFGDVISFTLTGLLVASHNVWLGVKVLGVAVVIDQIIDQAIAPRLLGKFTGLRPVWIVVALLVGTKIAGLPGLLTAVPLASVIKSAIDGFPPMPDLSPLTVAKSITSSEGDESESLATDASSEQIHPT